MAHIFKHPEGTQKGIIVFTHKEIHYFKLALHSRRFHFVNSIQNKLGLNKVLKPSISRKLEQIKRKYYIGVHFGSYHRDFPSYSFVDFYMSGKGTLTNPDPSVPFIPLNSRSFSSNQYKPDNSINKEWDILCVARNAKFKNLDRFIQSIRKVYDQGFKFKVLLFIATPPDENRHKHYVGIENDYFSMFTSEERERFIMIKLSTKYSFLGIGSTFIRKLYNESKIFALFSDVEGESRVISEALLSGLPIVVWDKLKGGGRDLLNESNSMQFSNYNDADHTLIEAVKNYSKFDIDHDKLAMETCEDSSIKKLLEEFVKLYKKNGETFDGELINTDNLANRLPGHDTEVPWSRGRFKTADIQTRKQFNSFLSHLKYR
jgi:glycosyltransferase involved in cell wall biosynthesis